MSDTLTEKVHWTAFTLRLKRQVEVTTGPTSIGFPSIGVSISVEEFHDKEGGYLAEAATEGLNPTRISSMGSEVHGVVISVLLEAILHISKTDPTKLDAIRPIIDAYRTFFDHHTKSNLAEAEYQEKRMIKIAENARKYDEDVTAALTEIAGPYVPPTPEEMRANGRAVFERLKEKKCNG